MNQKAIKSLAIVTAFHQLDWCPGTAFYECWSDGFVQTITEQAQANLEWAELNYSLNISDFDIATAIWGMDQDEFKRVTEEMAHWINLDVNRDFEVKFTVENL